MTFRRRLILALTGIGLLPLLVLGAGFRREMHHRVQRQADERARLVAAALRQSLDGELAAIRLRLAAAAEALRQDERLRPGLTGAGGTARRPLLDWAADAAGRGGLAMLQLHDGTGRILSSAHFRNDFDRLAPRGPALLAAAPGNAGILTVRTPSGALRVLATAHPASIAGTSYLLVGGVPAEPDQVVEWHGDGTLRAILVDAGEAAPETAIEVVRFPSLADPGDGSPGEARYLLVADPAPTAALLRSVDRWLMVATAVVLLASLLVAAALARRISRPLEALARQADRVDPDRPELRFDADRDDEIGDLARLLNRMTARLDAGAAALRSTERRIATGDLARQVNHDVKNGLVPIRNVVRHLAEVAEQNPAVLASVFAERRGTLESGIAHLESLARRYAGLSPDADAGSCRANQVIRESVDGLAGGGVPITLDLTEPLSDVRGDTVVLRRIVDNLVGNALDAATAPGGSVSIRSEAAAGAVRLTIRDTGRGMTRAELDRAFQAFHTTKEGGTGLGLAVVRQLVTDLGGALRVETAPGQGTTVFLELPCA